MFGSNMFSSNLKNVLSLPKVLSGLSKTLNVANKAIPLYKQAKPMINNSKKLLSIAKNFNNNSNEKSLLNKNTKINNIGLNQPKFFQ